MGVVCVEYCVCAYLWVRFLGQVQVLCPSGFLWGSLRGAAGPAWCLRAVCQLRGAHPEQAPGLTHTLAGVRTEGGEVFSFSSTQAGSWPELPCLWGGLWFVAGKEKISERHFLLGFRFPKAGASLGIKLGVLVGEGREN